jgi:hypothetical protein
VKRRDRTTEFERYFFMAVIAVGLLTTVIFAFTMVDKPLEEPFTAFSGVAILSLGGLQLRAIHQTLQQPPSDLDYSTLLVSLLNELDDRNAGPGRHVP